MASSIMVSHWRSGEANMDDKNRWIQLYKYGFLQSSVRYFCMKVCGLRSGMIHSLRRNPEFQGVKAHY